jgi:hypothetical protein
MAADKKREETLIQSRPDRVLVGAPVFRALPFLLICVHLPSAVKLFFNCLVPAKDWGCRILHEIAIEIRGGISELDWN